MAAGDADVPSEVRQLTDSLKQVYASDGRVALFDVDCAVADKNVMLRGVTTSSQARDALLHELSALGYRCMDCLRVLPDTLETMAFMGLLYFLSAGRHGPEQIR